MPMLISNSAIRCCKLKQYAEAVKAYRQTVTHQPARRGGIHTLGVAHTYLKEYPDAVEAFGSAVKLTPDDALAQFNLGLAELELDQLQNAEQRFEGSAPSRSGAGRRAR